MKDKRNKGMETEQAVATEATEASQPATIDVTTWFSIKLKEHKKLRPGHYAPVVAYFKSKNLKEHETKEAFDKALKEFGF